MTLKNWMNKRGINKTMKDLKVSRATVTYWGNYNCLPNPVNMRKIVKLSMGGVSYKTMIEEFIEANSQRVR